MQTLEKILKEVERLDREEQSYSSDVVFEKQDAQWLLTTIRDLVEWTEKAIPLVRVIAHWATAPGHGLGCQCSICTAAQLLAKLKGEEDGTD